MHFRESFHSINPNSINATNLVELQVSFMAIKVKRGEYIFLPKLRSICVLDRIVEKVSIHLLNLKQKLINDKCISSGLQYRCYQNFG